MAADMPPEIHASTIATMSHGSGSAAWPANAAAPATHVIVAIVRKDMTAE